ncbi:MAG TPA: ABC transporter permease [Clostridia bacterium]|nr:ABC transporter permease [Clostridia bacterium]
MKKALVFADRCQKEMLRDPLTYIFSIGLPIVLLVMMTLLNRSIPGAPFALETFAPGMAVFGLAFSSLFTGMLVAKDRASSFLLRAFASPLRAGDFVLGYTLPLLLMALIQGAACFAAAAALGLAVTPRVLPALIALLPAALLYVGLGLMMGTVMSDRQVGGIASILINAATLLSGTWFPLELVGAGFRKVCYALPFAHAVDAVRLALSGGEGVFAHLAVVLAYAAAVFALGTYLFGRKMRGGKV